MSSATTDESETTQSDPPARRQRLSLALRLILSSAILTLGGLVVAGFILTNLYRNSVEGAFDARLDAYSNALIGELAGQQLGAQSGELTAPKNIAEPRFLELLSGWYWQVGDASNQDILFSSDSLFGSDLTFLSDQQRSAPSGTVISETRQGPGGESIRQLEQTIGLPNDQVLIIVVTGNVTELEADIDVFRSSLVLTFGIFALFLVLAIYLQVKLGLRPLQKIGHALRSVQAGKSQSISGSYPPEMLPVVDEINGLIVANKGVVERARTHVGNLAHGLKTPLSVIANEAQAGQVEGQKLTEQVQLMRDQINHYLARARTAAGLAAVGTVSPVTPVIESLVRAMRKIYARDGIEVSDDLAADIVFKGEKHDLEEIAGNLMDNACKWASSEVRVKTEIVSETQWRLTVEDDGDGMTPDQCKQALKRGRRLDETVAGSGLGLNIVVETVTLYEGKMELERSDLGGLQAVLTLPRVR